MIFESEYRYKPPFYLRRWVHVLVLVMFVLGLAGVIFVSVKLAPYRARAQEFNFSEINKLEKASIIYDREGEELGRIFVLNRDPVPIEKIPHHMIDAVVAAEDSRFFKHDGVDRVGMVRAFIRNVKAGSLKQGASTITQQLARNAYGMKARSYERKLVEAFLAMRIEKNFSKSEIMGMYLNRIYFGSGFYGVNAASKGYFGKEVSEIDVSEAATLAGLIKSPNKLSPLNNPDLSKRERNYVFYRMAAENMLTPKEAKELAQKPLSVATKRNEKKRSFEYAYQQVRQQVVELLGSEQAATGGFHIYTTIDSKLQMAVHKSLVAQLHEIEARPEYEGQTHAAYEEFLTGWKRRERPEELDEEAEEEKPPVPKYLQGAAIVLDNRTGAIRAMVGGRDFNHSQFDRTMMARRKSGTVFTPFVYAAGLRNGKLPGEKIDDSPLDNRYVQIGGMGGILGEWGVEGEYSREGFLPARMALVKGKNAATVRYGMEVGVDNVVQFAKDAGLTFEGDLQKYNSTFLGHSDASISEMALAYTIFPNLGRRAEQPFLIQSIRDNDHKMIFRVDSLGPNIEVIPSFAAFQIHNALTDVLRIGTGKKAREEYGLGDFPVAGKTGTTSEFKDQWFAGYSDKITCVVWAGFDRARTIYPAAFSKDTVLPIWTDIMNAAEEVFPAQPVSAPPNAQAVEICTISGDRATEHCYHHHHGDEEGAEEKQVRDSYIEFFDPSVRFVRTCAVHRPGGIVNRALLRPIKEVKVVQASPIAGVHNNIGYGSRAKPILLHEPTVIGEDPYNSIPLLMRLKKRPPKPKPEPAPEEEGIPSDSETPSEGEIGAETVADTGEEGAVPPELMGGSIFVRPPGSDSGEGGTTGSNVFRAVPLEENAPQPAPAPTLTPVGPRYTPPPPHEERGPPARTEDGLPSILEEEPTFRLRPPRAQRIPFD